MILNFVLVSWVGLVKYLVGILILLMLCSNLVICKLYWVFMFKFILSVMVDVSFFILDLCFVVYGLCSFIICEMVVMVLSMVFFSLVEYFCICFNVDFLVLILC